MRYRLQGQIIIQLFQGVQRCLVLIYYVQLWLEASTPSLLEKIKPPHKIADVSVIMSIERYP